MMTAIGQKPPAITWLGQFFVPFGKLIGSVDIALLLSVFLTQFLTLFLISKALGAKPGTSIGIPIAGILVVAAAPLFVAMSDQYFTESIQNLTVVWFVVIAAYAPGWNRSLILGQLIAASSAMMLAKVSTPLYVVAPALFAFYFVIRPAIQIEKVRKHRRLNMLTWVFGIPLLVATVGWYSRNWQMAITHLRSAAGEGALLYGTVDTFNHMLEYRIVSAQQDLGFPLVVWFWVLLVTAAFAVFVGKAWRKRPEFSNLGKKRDSINFNFLALASAFQIALVIFAFSFSYIREDRYLLPIIPFVSILIAWSLSQINLQLVTVSVIAVLILQWGFVYGQAFRLGSPSQSLTIWLKPFNANSQEAEALTAVVEYTCNEQFEAWRYNIIGVELPFLNANSASYYAAKAMNKHPYRCYYTGLGYAESDADKAWRRMFDLKALYFVTMNPTLHKLPDDPFNRTSEQILDRISEGHEFTSIKFTDDPGLLVFRSQPDGN